MSKYDEDLKKACEILNNTELDELVQVAVEAMDDAATDIGMEASQEWHAKITLESALIHIAEKVAKRPQLTIPKSIADKLDKDDANNKTVLDWVFATEMIVINDEKELKRREDEILRRRAIVSIYGASKALGVELVKVVEG